MNLQVLLVDDEASDRYLIRETLLNALPDCQLVEMSSGAQLTAWFEQARRCPPGAEAESRITVILLDMHMPVHTGLDTLARLGDRRDLAYTPIVLMTASLSSPLKQQAYEQGVHLVLAKPSGPWGFYRVVEAVKQCYRDVLRMDNQLEPG